MTRFSGSLDANVLLRLLLNDLPEHNAAAVKLLKNTAGQFAIADTAIIEIVFVLERHYQFTRPQITQAIEGLMALYELNCNQALFAKALPLFAQCPALSFEDCCLATYAELNDAKPLWTFDQKLAKQAASATLVPAVQ